MALQNAFLEPLKESVPWLFSGAGIVIAAGLFAILRNRFWPGTGDQDSEEAVVRFFNTPKERYNNDFYDYFIRKITSARDCIYITGDGFECADEEGRRIASNFDAAFRQALSRQVNVVRIQTTNEAHPIWTEMLAKLLDDFPDLFDLYLIRDTTVSQMSSACAIDPDREETSLVELMLSTQRLFGTRTAELAGTALFIEGKPDLAKDMRSRILAMADKGISIHCPSGDAVRSMIGKRQYLFTYGSNMSREQMADRAPSALPVSIGVLRDYALVFNRKGSYRPGGVASVEKAPGDRVYGMIYSITERDLERLDRTEDPDAYRRIQLDVSGLDGTKYSCHLHVAIPQGPVDPDPEYLELVVKAAAEIGLPDEYIERLRAFRDFSPARRYSPAGEE